jgi:DNA-binding CsgD family transcriptional regulator
MSAAEAEKLVLIPTGPASSLEPGSVEPAADRKVPLSGTRVSHRGLADQTPHQPLGGGTRLNRESLLGGDWRIVDVERRSSQLRVFLRPGGALMSSRENEVLRSVLSGIPDRELSLRMGITRQCVCGHLGNGVAKLGSNSRFTALQAWRVLGEAEKGRLGRATIAEVAFGEDKILSLRCDIPPRPEIEVRLSSAETHVAWLVCDGLSNRDIAVERGTAERTVANQVASIFNKLEVCRRFELAQYLLGLR